MVCLFLFFTLCSHLIISFLPLLHPFLLTFSTYPSRIIVMKKNNYYHEKKYFSS